MKKILTAFLLIALGASVGIGGFYIYQKNSYEKTIIEESKFPKNTKIKINDWETYASYETALDIYNNYLNSCKKNEFTFNIKLKDKNYTLDLTDCYEHSVKLSDLEEILKKISFKEYMLKESIEFTLEDKYVYDESKVKEKFSDFLKNTTYEYVEPQDATYDEENYKVIESVDGTKVVETLAIEDYIKAIEAESFSLDLDNEKYFEKAKVQTKDLEEKYKDILQIANWQATYTVTNYVISMRNYMDYVKQNEDGTYSIDTSFMKSAVLALSKTIDKNTAMERTFKTTLDGSILITQGSYNQIMDNTKEIDYLIKQLEKREPCIDREPIWIVKPVASGQEKTYVEIDLSEQHVWYYEDGKVVLEADCVTGTDNTSRETPTGVYYISQMINGTYLTGPTWHTWVDKWMRVTSDGVGLHDAQWRKAKEFGGDTYKTDGSHGCINLPKEFAYNLYDKVEIGTMVIIHE